MKRLVLLFCLIGMASGIIAQETFQGDVKYAIEYIQLPEEIQGFESMLPKEMTISYKGMKSRLAQEVPGMGPQVVITDYSTNSAIVMMDMLGEKIAIIPTEEEMKNAADMQDDSEIDIRKKDTKKIAGYKCKKAIITSPAAEAPISVYFTDKLEVSGSQFQGLEGLPLEYTQNQGDMQLRLTAQEILQKELDDTIFMIPADYEQMTTEELQAKFGALDVEEVEE